MVLGFKFVDKDTNLYKDAQFRVQGSVSDSGAHFRDRQIKRVPEDIYSFPFLKIIILPDYPDLR